MPRLKFSHVVSFSSEDPSFPADNILSSDASKKWKCQAPGEKSANVILQLEKASVISNIDIGNENSAYVEVLASRSSACDDYKVLLMMSAFMTPMESRQGTNMNKVRMFGPNDLAKPVSTEKWDRIKVVCTQPFNKHTTYGLAFLTLHSPEEKETLCASESITAQECTVASAAKALPKEVINKAVNTNAVTEQKDDAAPLKLGKFSLRPKSPEDDLAVGSLFAKRKESLSAAAAIREASASDSIPESSTNVIKRKKMEVGGVPSKKLKFSDAKDRTVDVKSDRNRQDLLYASEDDLSNEKMDRLMAIRMQEKEKENLERLRKDKEKEEEVLTQMIQQHQKKPGEENLSKQSKDEPSKQNREDKTSKNGEGGHPQPQKPILKKPILKTPKKKIPDLSPKSRGKYKNLPIKRSPTHHNKQKDMSPEPRKILPTKDAGRTPENKKPMEELKPSRPENKDHGKDRNNIASNSKRGRDSGGDRKNVGSPKLRRINKVKEQNCVPFKDLLKGVVFVISGIQNPDRTTLRQMALAMGAKYKADWDRTCTHLICAYPNTPKFKQVRGHGKIVRRRWIEQCFAQRKRLPWRRFALDDKDKYQTESEDEIPADDMADDTADTTADTTAYTSDLTPSSYTQSDVHLGSSSSRMNDDSNFDSKADVETDGYDTEDEVRRIRGRTNEEFEIDVFGSDTDLDMDDGYSLGMDDSSPSLPDFFKNMVFYIDKGFPDEERKLLARYITAFDGMIEENLENPVSTVVATEQNIDYLRAINPIPDYVRPDWIWDLWNKQMLLPLDNYRF